MVKFKNCSVEEYLKKVRTNGCILAYVPRAVQLAHPEICLEAVKQIGYALEYVENQTEQICLEAVKQDGDALQFVEKFYPSLLKLNSKYMEEYKEAFAKEIAEWENSNTKEVTMRELEEHFGCKVKIVG